MAHFRVCIIGGGVTAMFYLATYKPDTGLKGIQQKIKRGSQLPSLEEMAGQVEEKDKFSDHLLWAPLNPWVIGKQEYKHVGRGDDYGMGQSPWINSLKKPSEFKYSTDLQTREAFYEEQSAILYKAEKKQGLTYHHGVVEKLEIIQHQDSFIWKITGYHFSDGSNVKKEVTADKILLMTGTGDEAKTPSQSIKFKGFKGDPYSHPRVLSLNQYMRMLPYHYEKLDSENYAEERSEKKRGKVVIQGGNAAIDAVWQSMRRGLQVTWLAGDRGAVMLPNTPLKEVTNVVLKGKNDYGDVYLKGRPLIEVEVQEEDNETPKLKITKTNEPKGSWDDVDFYVYAIGQDASIGPSGAVKLLRDSGLDDGNGKFMSDDKFEPIKDVDFALFDPKTQKATSYIGALGLRLKREQAEHPPLDVLGAASLAVIDIQKSAFTRQLQYGVYYQVGSVVDVRQIGGIRALMEAYNKYVEDHTQDGAELNFFAAAPNDIVSYLVGQYDMPPTMVNQLTELLLWVRLQPKNTNGFSKEQALKIVEAFQHTNDVLSPALEKAEKNFQDYWCKVFNLPRWPSQAERDAWPRIFQASATWGLKEAQRDVLQLAANGMLAKDIAERLKLGGEGEVKDVLKEIIELASKAEGEAIKDAIKDYQGKGANELVGIVQWILWNRF